MKIHEGGLFLNCAQTAEYIGIGRRSFYYLKNLLMQSKIYEIKIRF